MAVNGGLTHGSGPPIQRSYNNNNNNNNDEVNIVGLWHRARWKRVHPLLVVNGLHQPTSGSPNKWHWTRCVANNRGL